MYIYIYVYIYIWYIVDILLHVNNISPEDSQGCCRSVAGVAGLRMIHYRYWCLFYWYVIDTLLICCWYLIETLLICYWCFILDWILLNFLCILGDICNSPARRFQKRTLCSRCISTPLTLRSAGSWLLAVGTVTSRSMIWTRACVWRIRAWRGMRAKCVHYMYTCICIYVMYICIYVMCIYIYIYSVYIYMCSYIYRCMYAYTWARYYTHTHTHTHTQDTET